MNQKNYFSLTGIIFTIIALLHLARVSQGWVAVIGGFTLPFWVSWTAIIVAGYLGYQGLKHGR